jgi:hypothetical protein
MQKRQGQSGAFGVFSCSAKVARSSALRRLLGHLLLYLKESWGHEHLTSSVAGILAVAIRRVSAVLHACCMHSQHASRRALSACSLPFYCFPYYSLHLQRAQGMPPEQHACCHATYQSNMLAVMPPEQHACCHATRATCLLSCHQSNMLAVMPPTHTFSGKTQSLHYHWRVIRHMSTCRALSTILFTGAFGCAILLLHFHDMP